MALYESVDWASTPLGPPSSWDQALRHAVGLVLTTRFPATLLWGDDLVLVYNDAYARMVGEKHPDALGRRCVDVFPEAWADIEPMLRGVLADEGPTWAEDVRMPLAGPGGKVLERFFTFGYSPVRDDEGRVVGVLDITAETTHQVVDRRRLELLARLSERLTDLEDPELLGEEALPLLRAAALDLPEVDLLPAVAGGMPAGRDVVLGGTTAAGRTRALVRLPGAAPRTERPVLVVGLHEEVPADGIYLEFLVLVAGVLGTALERARAHTAERASGALARSMSEALQRDLLGELPQPAGLQLAARYQPAGTDLRVGGDWYDAFVAADGGTCVVVGDVSGHDAGAAVAMAQVRNVLRGVGHALAEPPALVLTALDRAMGDLRVGALATGVLARVEPVDGARDGAHLFRWSNAGHPPPVLVHPDGRAELLTRRSDLLLGLGVEASRRDHEVLVPPGSTLLLYTDGLVERRDAHLSDGLAWVRDATAALVAAGADAEELCDALLQQVGAEVDDDVALLAVRCRRRGA